MACRWPPLPSIAFGWFLPRGCQVSDQAWRIDAAGVRGAVFDVHASDSSQTISLRHQTHDTRCLPKQTEAGRDHHQPPSDEMTITEHDPE
jgi:hypothetical protein